MSYADLAEKLAGIGIKDNERNIANKIARGSFTAVFFVQCLDAIGVKTIHLKMMYAAEQFEAIPPAKWPGREPGSVGPWQLNAPRATSFVLRG